MGVAAKTAEQSRAADVLDRSADTSIAALLAAAHRLADLAVDAAELDEWAAAIRQRSAELDERERTLARERAAVGQMHAELLEQARALEKRASRFHWRWFVRAWSWRPPRLSAKARTCELFFIPSPGGYKLLEQTGVALTPQAQLTGLLDERTTHVVTKIAQRPFDGRWCAYLEISDFRGGMRND